MEKWKFVPTKSIGKIIFGVERDSLRETINMEYKEYRKSKYSKNTADDFGEFHVFYTPENRVEAVEIFSGIQIVYGDNVLFPGSINEIKKVLGTMEEDSGSFVQYEKSVGIYAPDGEIESILLGAKGYYM